MQAAWNQWAASTMTQATAGTPVGMAAATMTPYGAPAQPATTPAAAQPNMNYQYYGAAAAAAATPAAPAMPTLPTYTAEQWAVLTPEQQSWHMAQWHQQQAYYTQWQQMAAAQAAQAASVAPPLPPSQATAVPPPLPEEKKRPADDSSAETGASKKQKTDDKTGVKPETLEDLLELRKSFDTQFSNWENEYFKWKEANANHPDQAQKKEYEAKWSQWREQLLHKRDVIDKKIADKKKSLEEEERKQAEEKNKAASAWSNAYSALSNPQATQNNWLGAHANNAPLQFMTRTTGGVPQIPGLGDSGSKSDSGAGGTSGGTLPGDKPLDNTKPLWSSDNAPFNFPAPTNTSVTAPAAMPPASNPYGAAQSYQPGMPGYPGIPGYAGMMMQPGGYNPMMPYQYAGMSGMMAGQYPGNATGTLPTGGTSNAGQQAQTNAGQTNTQQQGAYSQQYPPGNQQGLNNQPAQANSQYQSPNAQFQGPNGPNAQYQGGPNNPNMQYPGGQNQGPPGQGGPPNSQYQGGQGQAGPGGFGGPPGRANAGGPSGGARKSRFSDLVPDDNQFGGRGDSDNMGPPGPNMGGPSGPNMGGPSGPNMGGPHGDKMGGPFGNNNYGSPGGNNMGMRGNNMGPPGGNNMGPPGGNNMGPNQGRNSFGGNSSVPSHYADKYAKQYEEDDETEFENYHQRFAAEDGTEEESSGNNSWRSGPAGKDRNSSGSFNRGGRESGGFGGARDQYGGGQESFGNSRDGFGNDRDGFGNNREGFGNNRESFGNNRDGFGNNSRNSFGNGRESGGNDFGFGANRKTFGPRDGFTGGPPANSSSGPPPRDFSGRDSFGPNKGPGGPPSGPSRFGPTDAPYQGPPPQGRPDGPGGYGAPPKSRWGARENEPPGQPPPGVKKAPDETPQPLDKPHTCVVVEYNHRKVPAAMSIELVKGYNEPYRGPVFVFEYSHGANKREFFRQRAGSPSRRRSPLRDNYTSPIKPDVRTMSNQDGRESFHPALRGKFAEPLRDRSPSQGMRHLRREERSPDRRTERDRRSPDYRTERDRRSPDHRTERNRRSPDYRTEGRDRDRRGRDRSPDEDRSRGRYDRERDVILLEDKRVTSSDERKHPMSTEDRLARLEDRLVEERRKLDVKSRQVSEQKKIAIEDLLEFPGRETRPSRIVIFLRGPPCSGKSFLAKIIKDKEAQHGGATNMRILSLDDYFMTSEVEKEIVDERGQKKTIKAFEYEYEKELEESYRQSLVKAFKKTVNDAYFSFIIVDACNDQLSQYAEMYVHAKGKGFAVYIAETSRDVSFCLAHNVHHRGEEDIRRIATRFQTTPREQVLLDTTSLLQSAEIEDVEMEDVENDEESAETGETLGGAVSDDDDDVVELEMVSSKFTIPSKWDNIDHSIGEIKAKLDGLCRKAPKSLRDWLGDEGNDELSIYNSSREGDKGKKRVRWADIEEKFEQDKMKAIGFIVGGTDWNRMMDPESGVKRMNQTKYI